MVKKITSVNNPTIVEFSKLSNSKIRFLTGLFSVEGEKPLKEILESDVEVRDIFVTEDFKDIEFLPEDKITLVTEAVMKKLSSSDTPPKVLTVAYQMNYDVVDFENCGNLLLLDGISDPGNMGTLIRTAVAFGFEGILLHGNCVDLYNQKVIRSSAGNFFKIPLLKVDITDIINLSKNYNFSMTNLHSDNVIDISKLTISPKNVLVLGSEANGISNEILEIPHIDIKVMTKSVESLNVATAGAILMYEFSKQMI
ncbi:MAG: TrmH family RNA methyltransferase [Candidatus Gastranaerophilaceae bacterium]